MLGLIAAGGGRKGVRVTAPIIFLCTEPYRVGRVGGLDPTGREGLVEPSNNSFVTGSPAA